MNAQHTPGPAQKLYDDISPVDALAELVRIVEGFRRYVFLRYPDLLECDWTAPISYAIVQAKKAISRTTAAAAQDSPSDVAKKARRALIAEAGTAYYETGLTPRQLAEQRAELLEALREICAILGRVEGLSAVDMKTLMNVRDVIQKAVSHE